ncbi:peptide ABC transporter substrate-binding protein [Paenibacillus campi]|uniref:peptide ABC transporter substrate-binding protein n=1 Tax=Paenibacillus campi TaxID=3106031 RepID=UPI002AFE25C0|nr:peptide ABC transporter substrate-binding protein [Paenibacillus sp. SGZ-1009]
MSKQRTALLFILILLTGVLSACGSGSPRSDAATSADVGNQDLIIANTADVSTLDSSLATSAEDLAIIDKLGEGLYRPSETGVELAAASAVKVSADQKTYTFTIRDEKWSDGSPVTAHDFEYAWKRLANPATKAEYSYMLFVAGVKNAENVLYHGAALDTLGVKATDDKTLVVQLDRVVPYFDSLIAGTYFAPINEQFAVAQGDQYGLSKQNVLSNGPFVISNWTVGGDSVVLTKNSHYWDQEHINVHSLTYKTVKDSQSGILAYQSQQLDYVEINGDEGAAYKDAQDYHTRSARMLYYFQPNLKVKALNNVNLRLALALAYDKNAIVNRILKDGSVPANFLIVNSLASGVKGETFRDAAKATYLEPDKAKAVAYFNKAKSELKQDKFTFELLYDDNDTTKQIAQFYQSEIQTTLPGITINLKSQPKKNRVALASKGDFQIMITRWGADYDDPSTYFDLFTERSGYNYGHWVNPQYNQLVKGASEQWIASPQKRLDAYIKAEQVLLDDAAIFPIYQAGRSYLLQPRVHVAFSPEGWALWRTATISN